LEDDVLLVEAQHVLVAEHGLFTKEIHFTKR
jgi:hypothetical protein